MESVCISNLYEVVLLCLPLLSWGHAGIAGGTHVCGKQEEASKNERHVDVFSSTAATEPINFQYQHSRLFDFHQHNTHT